MRAWLLVLVFAGCNSIENRGLGRTPERAETPHRKRLDVTFVSHCPKPIEVCYGKEHCMTLADSKPKLIHADTLGGTDVFVRLPSVDKSVFANITFDQIEVDESCEHLERHLGPSQEIDQQQP